MIKWINGVLLVAIVVLGMATVMNSTEKKEVIVETKEEIALDEQFQEEEVKESLVLSSMQINEMVSGFSKDYLNDLNVGLNTNDEVEFSFLIDDDFLALVQLDDVAMLKMFNGQRVNCTLQVNDGIEINSCTVAGLEIPSSLYQGKVEEYQEKAMDIMSGLGIEDVEVSSQLLEIKGDISRIVEQMKK